MNFLKKHNIDFEQIDITNNEKEMRKELGEKFNIIGDVTVPQIIIDGERLGGYEDLIANPDKVFE